MQKCIAPDFCKVKPREKQGPVSLSWDQVMSQLKILGKDQLEIADNFTRSIVFRDNPTDKLEETKKYIVQE